MEAYLRFLDPAAFSAGGGQTEQSPREKVTPDLATAERPAQPVQQFGATPIDTITDESSFRLSLEQHGQKEDAGSALKAIKGAEAFARRTHMRGIRFFGVHTAEMRASVNRMLCNRAFAHNDNQQYLAFKEAALLLRTYASELEASDLHTSAAPEGTASHSTQPAPDEVNVNRGTALEPALMEKLQGEQFDVLRAALDAKGIRTLEEFQKTNLWVFMNQNALYSIGKRQEVYSAVLRVMQGEDAARSEAGWKIITIQNAYTGHSPAEALMEYCRAIATRYPLGFRGLIGQSIPYSDTIPLSRSRNAADDLSMETPQVFFSRALDPNTALTCARWVGKKLQDSDMPQSIESPASSIAKKTITEVVFDVLRRVGKPMTVSDIYQTIIQNNLYPFGAKDPMSVVYGKISLACKQTDDRIIEGKDVLIRSEIDGRKVFQVMSASEAAAYLKKRPIDAKVDKASPWIEYEAVLKQAFPKGFQKGAGLEMKRLRKRWAEIHGEELKDSDDTIRLQLAAHCVDTGKRWYLAELLLSDEDRQTVLRYIDWVLGSGKSVLYYSSIYAALEHHLESAVLTEDLLVSYLQATCQDRYILRAHYLTNDRHAQVDLSEEIKEVMLAHGVPIHTDELKRALHHLPPDQVERELHIRSEFIKDGSHMYFHESMVDLTDQELDQIASFIQEELDDQGYMIGALVQQKLSIVYPEIAERLSFLTPMGVRGAVAYKLRDCFTFSRTAITPKGQEMNMIDFFAMFCYRHAPFTLEQLSTFAEECDSPIYWDTVHENCARVSETEFVAPEAVRWDIPHVDAAIALCCPGKYVSLKSIQYFDAFSFAGYPWNSYLLEQYVATVSKEFMLMHSSYAKNNTSGAIVRRDAGLAAFDDVLADVLANSAVALEREPCLEHLANKGYITRKKLSNINEIITRAISR